MFPHHFTHCVHFYLQHDDNYPDHINVDTYSHTLHEGDAFFVRKFNGDSSITSKQLREEEYELASGLYSSDDQYWHHHIRDFFSLCRGENVVSVPS